MINYGKNNLLLTSMKKAQKQRSEIVFPYHPTDEAI